jgi:hypothetical protein
MKAGEGSPNGNGQAGLRLLSLIDAILISSRSSSRERYSLFGVENGPFLMNSHFRVSLAVAEAMPAKIVKP